MKRFLVLLLLTALVLCGCLAEDMLPSLSNGESLPDYGDLIDLSAIPEFSGEPYVAVNGNMPDFTEDEITSEAFESYAELDALGRCGVAVASIGKELMPTEERGSIGSVKPTGWQISKYDFVDGRYLFNRCHLIGFQLSGENANKQNLITGTRYLNVQGMLPFENMVADYVKETGNHVMYRVTPVFEGDNLVACGVQMEGYSVEDNGEGICFNVYCYNVQPNVEIDYADGSNRLAEENSVSQGETIYILNINTMKFHHADCESAQNMKESNRQETTASRETLIASGYTPCGNCNP